MARRSDEIICYDSANLSKQLITYCPICEKKTESPEFKESSQLRTIIVECCSTKPVDKRLRVNKDV